MISAARRLYATTHTNKKVPIAPEPLLRLAAALFVFPRAHIATNSPVKCLHSYFETRDSKLENLPARLKDEELIERTVEIQPECICVSVLPPTSIAQARHLAAAIQRKWKRINSRWRVESQI